MRFDTSSSDDEIELNLTALIDVIFTLIIFFVVTTSFNNRSALKITLPSSQASHSGRCRGAARTLICAGDWANPAIAESRQVSPRPTRSSGANGYSRACQRSCTWLGSRACHCANARGEVPKYCCRRA